MDSFKIAALYKFVPVEKDRLAALRDELITASERFSVRGLIILAPEGLNGTVAASPPDLDEFIEQLTHRLDSGPLEAKYSSCARRPFRRFKVDIRPEIVTFDRQMPCVDQLSPKRLSPAEWNEMLHSGDDVVVLDTRNTYESDIGKFKGALVPPIAKFSQFREFVEVANIPKDKKVLMYCTGGIRCEKASLEMERQGYSEVYQLAGGILKYLEEYPNADFEGECFVFDHRVAVDQQLKPSTQYSLCPHCGNPGKTHISCSKCSKPVVICGNCERVAFRDTCSKNCAQHQRRVAARAAAREQITNVA